MERVAGLVTFADLGEDAGPDRMSVSARHEAVLDNGRRVLLLDGRGWSASLRGPGVRDGDDAWAYATEQEIDRTARMVVGPDEAYGDRTQADMETGHWNTLAGNLQEQGIEIDADELAHLPHEVVISDRLRARLA